MTIPAPSPSELESKSGFRSLHLTRTTAWLLSLFGPGLLLVPLLLVVMAMRAFQAYGGGNDVLGLIGMLLFVAAAVTMRVYFARWYALDKGQGGAWGIAGVFGLLGWLLLWRLADLNAPKMSEPILPPAQQNGSPGAEGAPLSSAVLVSDGGSDERKDPGEARVKARSILRMLVLADAALTVAFVTAELMLEETLPEPVRAYVASEEIPTALLIPGTILLLLLPLSWVALWRFWSRAHFLYAATWAGGLAFGPFTGPQITTGVGESFSSLSSVVAGAILALLFLSPLREEFSRRPAA